MNEVYESKLLKLIYKNKHNLVSIQSDKYELKLDNTHHVILRTSTNQSGLEEIWYLEFYQSEEKREAGVLRKYKIESTVKFSLYASECDIKLLTPLNKYINDFHEAERKRAIFHAKTHKEELMIGYLQELTKNCKLVWNDTE